MIRSVLDSLQVMSMNMKRSVGPPDSLLPDAKKRKFEEEIERDASKVEVTRSIPLYRLNTWENYRPFMDGVKIPRKGLDSLLKSAPRFESLLDRMDLTHSKKPIT